MAWSRDTRRARFALVSAALAVAAPAFAEGGNIKGKVTATPAKYLENTVVYVKDVKGTYPPAAASMDQKGMRFVPPLLIVTEGTTVKFLNHDNVVHNVYSPDHEGFNVGSFKRGEERSYTFKKPGAYTLLCSIHPEMLGYIFVGQNPYAAPTGTAGEYEIPNVPPGTYKVAVWNPKLKAPEKTVTVTAGKTVDENFSIKR